MKNFKRKVMKLKINSNKITKVSFKVKLVKKIKEEIMKFNMKITTKTHKTEVNINNLPVIN